MKIAVTGSSGLIGSALTTSLQRAGHEVVRVLRRPPRPGESAVQWDPASGSIDADGLEGIDAAVNLAGAGIGDKRWTDGYKRTVLESRTRGTELLSRTLAGLASPPSVLVSGSAVGYYGDAGDRPVDETGPAGDDFLSSVCVRWEAAADPAREAGIRVATVRTGIVLSAEGGALAKLLPLFKLGLGGRMGSGSQWWSWITLDDEVAAIGWLLDHDVAGPVNLVGPNPATNAELTRTLGAVLHRPTVLPVPSFGPKLLLGSELAETLLFSSQRALPAVLEQAGFSFAHPTLGEALRHVLDRPAAGSEAA
jgi:uncharacterized protein (TIGR01777 family)